MALIDQFGLRALIAAAVQIALLVGVVLYGLWSPSLGARVLLPTLAMLPVWAGLMWLTLTRPWEWNSVEPREPLQRMWGNWEGVVVYGGALVVMRMHGRMLGAAKDRAAELKAMTVGTLEHALAIDDARAWVADSFGALILDDGGGWFAVGCAFFALCVVWFLLPR